MAVEAGVVFVSGLSRKLTISSRKASQYCREIGRLIRESGKAPFFAQSVIEVIIALVWCVI